MPNDSIPTQHANTVIEVPAPRPAMPLTPSPLHDTPSMLMLLAGILAVALNYRSGYKYIQNLGHYMFSARRRDNLFEDHTFNETKMLAALIFNTCVVEGLIIYHAVAHFVPALIPSLQASVFTHVLIFSALALMYYCAQWLAFKVVGYTFSDKVGAKLWMDGFKSTQSLTGLLLLPVMILLMLYPAHASTLLIVAAALFFSVRIIFIYKGFRIFYSNFPSIFYFLLYLCTLEIVPIAIMTTLTIWICERLY